MNGVQKKEMSEALQRRVNAKTYGYLEYNKATEAFELHLFYSIERKVLVFKGLNHHPDGMSRDDKRTAHDRRGHIIIKPFGVVKDPHSLTHDIEMVGNQSLSSMELRELKNTENKVIMTNGGAVLVSRGFDLVKDTINLPPELVS